MSKPDSASLRSQAIDALVLVDGYPADWCREERRMLRAWINGHGSQRFPWNELSRAVRHCVQLYEHKNKVAGTGLALGEDGDTFQADYEHEGRC